MNITVSAFENIAKALSGRPALGLRVGIRGGGCSGLQYVIEYCDRARKDDILVNGPNGIVVYIDPKSNIYLHDVTLDFEDTFQKKGFKFLNPNKKTECGCGESFSI